MGSVTPVFTNFLFGHLTATFGIKAVIICDTLVVFAAYVLFLVEVNRYAFLVGYAMVYTIVSLRRTVYPSYIAAGRSVVVVLLCSCCSNFV